MLVIRKLLLLTILGGLISVCQSCEKALIFVETKTEPVPPPVIPPKDTTSTTLPKPPAVFELKVGKGSGKLEIDGQSLNIKGKTIVKIKGGSYDEIKVSNLIYDDNNVVTIQNDGTVELVGNKQLSLVNIKNVIFSGEGTKGISRGFVFKNKSSDAPSVQLSGSIDNFTLRNFSFKDINSYNIIRYDPKKIYNGTDASYSKNIKILNVDCDNCGTLVRFIGSTENGIISGLVSNVEIANITFTNSPNVGSVISLENVDSYDIHDNLVKNVNQLNSNHNGIFYLQGNGKFYNNTVREHQGNAIRAWGYSIGSKSKPLLIFNNIVLNSREYGAFELQSFQRNIIPGRTTFIRAQVFNNTCGSMNPKGTFPAQILDLYGLAGGSCDIFNNIGYNFKRVGHNNSNFIWNELGDTKPSFTGNNRYYTSYKEAGIIDEDQLRLNTNSPLKNSGILISSKVIDINLFSDIVSRDIFGTLRSTIAPTIGAVE